MKTNIVTFPWFAWPIKRVLDLMIEFIAPLHNWLQQFINHYLTHCHLFRLDTLDFWPHFTTPLLRCTPSRLLTVPSYKSSAWTPRKTPSSVVKNASLLVSYLSMDVFLLLSAYASGMCLPSRYLEMGICVTICWNCFTSSWRHGENRAQAPGQCCRASSVASFNFVAKFLLKLLIWDLLWVNRFNISRKECKAGTLSLLHLRVLSVGNAKHGFHQYGHLFYEKWR
jgi:hypothetical protein